MLGVVPADLAPGLVGSAQARAHMAPILKVRIDGKRYRTRNWSLTGFRLDDFDGVCAWGEQIRGMILFKGCRGAVIPEAVRVGPGQAVGFRISRSAPTSSSE